MLPAQHKHQPGYRLIARCYCACILLWRSPAIASCLCLPLSASAADGFCGLGGEKLDESTGSIRNALTTPGVPVAA